MSYIVKQASSLRIWSMVFIAMVLSTLSYAQCPGASCNLAPGLFVSRGNLAEVKRRITDGEQPYSSFYNTFIGVADSAKNNNPDPFLWRICRISLSVGVVLRAAPTTA